jgi:hypothetical protein
MGEQAISLISKALFLFLLILLPCGVMAGWWPITTSVIVNTVPEYWSCQL